MIAERFMILIILLYLALLFAVAWWVQKSIKPGSPWVANRWIYALSLSVYCTTWAYYGSVGKASNDGISFITTYLGPVVFMPVWFWITGKMIKICRQYRITSLADFISSRYSKSSFLGGFVAIFCVIVIVPYIAIQLKAIGTGYDILTNTQPYQIQESAGSLLSDSNLYLTGILILFVILFGTRNIETATKNHGLISVVAFEAIVKLLAFVTVGIFVCFMAFD
ncbi:MAG: histidine kinase, partial [Bacteroidota bacterium]